MKKKNDLKILKFPTNFSEAERQVEAVLFAAEEPLDVASIQERLKTNTNVKKILESVAKQYENRGINLVCISDKWSFRTAPNLSKLMNLQKSNQKSSPPPIAITPPLLPPHVGGVKISAFTPPRKSPSKTPDLYL